MFSIPRMTALPFAAMLMLLSLSASADAKTACRHGARDCRVAHRPAPRRDWYLHRPSTPRERAQTRRLNEEAHSYNAMPAPIFMDRDHQDGERGYRQLLREYHAAQQRYERDMRWYSMVTDPRRPAPDWRPMSAPPRPPQPPAGMEQRDERYGYGRGAAGY